MLMKNPWFKFYPSDWRSDPRLRMCGLSARGLWTEMLGLMHEAEPYGHLLVNGEAPTDTQLAVLAGAPPDQIPDLIRELESAGVFSRTQKGVIYSRRQVRDEKKARLARKNGKNGGNPSLSKDGHIPASDNPPDIPDDKPQKPEAIPQKITVPIGTGAAALDDPWKRIYAGFKRHLGTQSGGLISKLRGQSTVEEMGLWLEQLDRREIADPREYFGAVLSKREAMNGKSNHNGGRKTSADFFENAVAAARGIVVGG